MKEFMTWNDVLASDATHVKVLSYGYMERNCLTSHFEPFANQREFEFKIDRESSSLEHRWLFLEESEDEITFFKENGIIYADDPDLWARPDY